MSNLSPDSLHEAVHRALLAGHFESVRQLSIALGQAIIREASAATPAARTALVQGRLSRLQEHLSLARVLRAHLANELQMNTAVCLYQPAAGCGHSWNFEA